MSKMSSIVIQIQEELANREYNAQLKYRAGLLVTDYSLGVISSDELIDGIWDIVGYSEPTQLFNPNDVVVYIGKDNHLFKNTFYSVTGVSPTHIKVNDYKYLPKSDFVRITH